MSAIATATQPVPSGTPLHSSPEPHAKLLIADRTAQLYNQLPLGVAASIVLVVVTVLALDESAVARTVYRWAAVALAVSLARGALWLAWRRSARAAEDAQRWIFWLGVGALANGALWGVLAGLFFDLKTEYEHLFLLLALAGVMVGGIAMYAASWPMYALYAAPVVLPFTYDLMAQEQDFFQAFALLMPMFYAVSVGVAYRLNTLFLGGFRAQHAFRKLNADYTDLNERLARQLDELTVARSQVEASGRKLALFVERSPVAVLELDREARALHVNPAAETLFGYAEGELIGRPVAEILYAQDERAAVEAQWQEMLRTCEPATHLRRTTRRRDGTEIVCEWSVTPLVNADGEVISVIAQGRDITQQLEAERLKQEFTSTLSHELRTPLTSVIGALQLVNSGALGEPDPEAREMTEIAERNSQRLLDLINDLLDLEKVESGKVSVELEAQPLDELVRESVALNRAFADRYGVRLAIAGSLPAAAVAVDRRRLLQVLTNLLSNAAKFSPEGETVSVSVDDLGARLRIGVHDRGPGIPPSFHGRIFSRFAQADMSVTRQKGGTGLGLAICKRLVELMNGQIGFSDREGGGTVFWIDLPKPAQD